MCFRITNKWMILGLLMLAYTLSFMDRYIMNLLLEPVKRDMNLTDTQVSLLAGAGFALLYAFMAIPLGRLSDKASRVKLVSAGIAVWSMMTTTCGLVKNFGQLLMARSGVGIGEATLSPSVYSILSDTFPKRLLATAIGVYSSGIYFGAGLAYIVGGSLLKYFEAHGAFHFPFIGQLYSWQMVFFIFGIPGLIISFLFLLVDEPIRNYKKEEDTFSQFLSFLKSDGKPFLILCAASAIFNITVYATGIWIPTFLTRIHHIEVSRVGAITGTGIMLFSPLGVIVGGRIADMLSSRTGAEGRLKSIIIFVLLFIPASLVYLFTTTEQATLYALVPYGLLVSASVAVTGALTQEIVPQQFKGTASACMLFSQNIIGMSVGSTSVGMMNDFIFHDPMHLGQSLAIVSIISLTISVALFIVCRRTLLTAKISAL